MINWQYIRLLDKKNKNTILRCTSKSWQKYDGKKWVETAMLIDYFTDISPYYDMYEKISEQSAEMYVGREAIKMPA